MGFPKYVELTKKFTWDVAAGIGSDSHADTGSVTVFSVPANCVVKSVRAFVETGVTGSTAEKVGDGSDDDGWLLDGFAAVAGGYPMSAEDQYAGVYSKAETAGAVDATDVSRSDADKLYSTADSIIYKITGTASAGRITFVVKFEQL